MAANSKAGGRLPLVLGLVIIVGLAGMYIQQQRRLSHLETVVKTVAPEEASGAAEGGAANNAWYGAGAKSGARATPSPGAMPAHVGAATPTPPTASPSAGPGGQPPSAPARSATPIGGSGAERLARSPASAISELPEVHNFIEQHGIDQGTWDAAVQLNKDWYQKIAQAKQRGVTSLDAPIQKLSADHDDRVRRLFEDPQTLKDFLEMQQKLSGHATLEFGGQKFDGVQFQ